MASTHAVTSSPVFLVGLLLVLFTTVLNTDAQNVDKSETHASIYPGTGFISSSASSSHGSTRDANVTTPSRAKRFLSSRILHSTRGISSFNLERNRLTCGDVSPNPGPRRRNPVRYPCGECGRSVRNNQEAILCANCNTWSYATCPGLWKKTFQYYLSHPHIDWECHACALPYRNHSFLLHPSDPEIKQVDEQEHNSLLPSCDYENDFLSQHAANMERSPHTLNIGQLNICGLRNKVDEVRIMLSLWKFDIPVITETHLDCKVSNQQLHVEGYRVIRRDRADRKGGGCVLHVTNQLTSVHLRHFALPKRWSDLDKNTNQIKFSDTRGFLRPSWRHQVFRRGNSTEKAWRKFKNLVLVGDFNVDYSGKETELERETGLR